MPTFESKFLPHILVVKIQWYAKLSRNSSQMVVTDVSSRFVRVPIRKNPVHFKMNYRLPNDAPYLNITLPGVFHMIKYQLIELKSKTIIKHNSCNETRRQFDTECFILRSFFVHFYTQQIFILFRLVFFFICSWIMSIRTKCATRKGDKDKETETATKCNVQTHMLL